MATATWTQDLDDKVGRDTLPALLNATGRVNAAPFRGHPVGTILMAGYLTVAPPGGGLTRIVARFVRVGEFPPYAPGDLGRVIPPDAAWQED